VRQGKICQQVRILGGSPPAVNFARATQDVPFFEQAFSEFLKGDMRAVS